MKKVLVMLYALLVVGVAAILPVPPAQASCTYLCAPIFCDVGELWMKAGGGDAYVLLKYRVSCGGSTNVSTYAECQEFPCASMSGTLYLFHRHRILAIQIANKEQGNSIGDFIEKNKNFSTEVLLAVIKTNFGASSKVMTTEEFNNRTSLKGCPA